MSLVQRLIDVTFHRPGGGTLGAGNTVKLSGLRVSAKIVKVGAPAMGQATLVIYGMTLDKMNDLSTLGRRIREIPHDEITVEAGDAASSMTTVFQGTIYNSWPDFDSAPDVGFHVMANSGPVEAVTTVPPTNYSGGVDVVTVLQELATQAGLKFESNGVSVKVESQYLYGPVRNQIRAVAAAAGIGWTIDDKTLILWPRDGAREGEAVLLSPKTGLIGYPGFHAYGITLRTIFNKAIQFQKKIVVESDLKRACGTWIVSVLDHDLEALTPGGKWQSSIEAYSPLDPAPLPR